MYPAIQHAGRAGQGKAKGARNRYNAMSWNPRAGVEWCTVPYELDWNGMLGIGACSVYSGFLWKNLRKPRVDDQVREYYYSNAGFRWLELVETSFSFRQQRQLPMIHRRYLRSIDY